jgi:aspartyl-tRNA(Asn)/glutamyl-tRNA(Gln) amidotransferase subunit B
MRLKEQAHDYRYLPDPDLLPIGISTSHIKQLRDTLPELPQQKRQRFINTYQLHQDTTTILLDWPELTHVFEQVLQQTEAKASMVANWMTGDFIAALYRQELTLTAAAVTPADLALLLTRIADKTISNNIAKQVLDAMLQGQGDADTIIAEQGLQQLTDSDYLARLIDECIAHYPQQVQQYQQGKDKVLSFFVGQVMKATQGKANPQQVSTLLKAKLTPPS